MSICKHHLEALASHGTEAQIEKVISLAEGFLFFFVLPCVFC